MDKSDSRTSGPLWKGRIENAIDHRMDPLNRSLPLDFRLWPQDVRGSRAWANALAGSGIIEEAERGELVEGLDRVSRLLAENDYSQEMDEDIHSLVERLLYSEIGDLAGKLHTGRSRNDQV